MLRPRDCLMLHSLRCLTVALAVPLFLVGSIAAEPLPSRLQGTWRITRVLPTTNNACWDKTQAQPLVGSTLTYRDDSLRWRGGAVPLQDITTRMVTDDEFRKENSGSDTPANFAQLGIRARTVLEVDLQHEDADITGATTEVPGDSVLLAGPNRLVVSACGVYFEATRNAAGLTHTSLRR